MARPTSRAKAQEDIRSIVYPKDMTGKIEINSPEDSVERLHRLKKDYWAFWIKDVSLYAVALSILTTTAIYCFWVLWRRDLPKDDRQWAMSTLTSLLVGIVGYVFGKYTK